jgi:hypothetical protein
VEPEQDRQNKNSMTGLPGKDGQDRATRIEMLAQDCTINSQGRAERRKQPERIV